MATTLSDKQVQALQQRHDFWAKQEQAAIEAGDADKLTTASNGKDKVIAEAQAGGVTLIPWTAPEPVQEGNAVAVPAASKKPKSVAGSEAVAAKAKKVAAAKAEGTPTGATKAKAAPKPKKKKVLQPCLDGCGTMVSGNFKMGHDAKLKSLILKIERGEMNMSDLPEIAQEVVGFKKGEKELLKGPKGENKGSVQLMVCTKAPVRFPGRPEITLTTR